MNVINSGISETVFLRRERFEVGPKKISIGIGKDFSDREYELRPKNGFGTCKVIRCGWSK